MIQNVPANEQVVIRGIDVSPPLLVQVPPLQLTNCVGSVHVEDLGVVNLSTAPIVTARVTGCGSVTFSRCFVNSAIPAQDGSGALDVIGSTIALFSGARRELRTSWRSASRDHRKDGVASLSGCSVLERRERRVPVLPRPRRERRST
ncbi:MAG: hypothetical protein R3F34_09765 [Planctomycetota bacterium]